jgi:heme exporter protein D
MNPINNFFAMGGYAAFIWPAYGLTALAFAAMLAAALRTLKARRREEQALALTAKPRRARGTVKP